MQDTGYKAYEMAKYPVFFCYTCGKLKKKLNINKNEKGKIE